MSDSPANNERDEYDVIDVDLKNPLLAAILSWLWPGAGQIYQGRYGKGVLFMVCVLGSYFFGLGLGGGKCVYASFTREDFRWNYIFQAGVGLPSAPAAIQAAAVGNGGSPPFGEHFMVPPHPVTPEDHDTLAEWHADLHTYFDLGTYYTMIAGLLNVLVICDALMGPALPNEDDRQEQARGRPKTSSGEQQRKKKRKGAKS